MTSVSDIGADAVVKTEQPPDSAGRNVFADIGYVFRLLAFHVRYDPIVGVLLWALSLGSASLVPFLGLQFATNIGAATNGLVAADRPAIVAALSGATFFATLSAANVAAQIAVQMFLRIRMRTVLTDDLLSRWLGGRHFYQPEADLALDHPEQRVQEDVYNFADNAARLLPILIGNVVSFVVYSQALWALARPMELWVPLGGEVLIPRALYVAAVVFAVLMTVVTHLIGRVVSRLEIVRQRIEAGFRHDLGRAREYAEQIVLSNGQELERDRAAHDYGLIRRNWTPYTLFTAAVSGVQLSSSLIPLLLPLWLLFGSVLAGEMQIGDLTVASAAFGAVYVAFSSASSNYLTFALLRSAALRIRLMDRSLARPTNGGVTDHRGDRAVYEVRDLHVRTVAGRPLLALPELEITRGQKWLVRGRSGSGKSTLFRTFAGIWPYGTGTIRQPVGDAVTMFLPQKPYLPTGSLAELLSYPLRRETFNAEEFRNVLRDVRLDHLVDDVDTARDWSKMLSGGEQQRVMLARALLHKPAFLFLDEATSSLDPVTEAEVFDALARQLSDTAVVTIAHGDRLARHHDLYLTIQDGTASVSRPGGDPQSRDDDAG